MLKKKMTEGVKEKNFAFILEGKKLKGRFAIKKVKGGFVLQKYKDKYAAEEDVLSNDLWRTIGTMIPDYDASKVKLEPPQKKKAKTRSTKLQEPEEEPEKEISADTIIGHTEYHFAFYTSADEPDICLVTSADGEVLVLLKKTDKWVLSAPVSKAVLKKAQVLTDHAEALYHSR